MSQELSVPNELSQLSPDVAGALGAYLNEGAGDDMKGLTPDFPRIGILHTNGAGTFQTGASDAAEFEKEIEGVILHNHGQKAWWARPMGESGGAGEKPQCYSLDGVLPRPDSEQKQAEDCGKCAHNEYGSDVRPDGSAGRGKACKDMRRLFILRTDQVFPSILVIPPTSLKNWSGYVTNLVNTHKMRPGICVTKVKAVQAASRDGVKFTRVEFSFVRVINAAEAELMVKMLERVRAYASPPTAGEYLGDAQEA